ncbi:MAG: hypothetical protein IJ568_00455 [Bacilli bacterium]|nr:hypothetical protein [Bacilli bacterium]
METLEEYFAYEKDYGNILKIYYNLSKELKTLHENNMIVPIISSKTITYNDGFKFNNEIESLDIERGKRSNIVSLAKLMLGTYLSLSTGFKDFSGVDTEWFSNNLDEICNSIQSEDFPKDYFYELLLQGKDEYFNDYINKIKQNENLGGKSNVNIYKKVLSNSASNFYQEQTASYDDVEIDKPKARLSMIMYPLLVLGTFLITLGFIMLIK